MKVDFDLVSIPACDVLNKASIAIYISIAYNDVGGNLLKEKTFYELLESEKKIEEAAEKHFNLIIKDFIKKNKHSKSHLLNKKHIIDFSIRHIIDISIKPIISKMPVIGNMTIAEIDDLICGGTPNNPLEAFINARALLTIYANYPESLDLLNKIVILKEKDAIIFFLEIVKNYTLYRCGVMGASTVGIIEIAMAHSIRTGETHKTKLKIITKRQEIVKKLAKEIDPKSVMKKYSVAKVIAKELYKHLPSNECVSRDTIAADLEKTGVYE